MGKNPSCLPFCYDHNMFYEGNENPFLAAWKTFQLSAGVFHQPCFFIWLPHLLVDRIPCPSCCETGQWPAKGPMAYLQRHGFAKQPHQAVDIDQIVYIIGYYYLCGNCCKSYQSWSPSILSILPPAVAHQFQFHLTYHSGLTERLATLLREAFWAGTGLQQFTTMIESFHYCRYDVLQCQFLEMILDHSTQGSLSSC